jgi:DNA-binding SARP family transcriptional activator
MTELQLFAGLAVVGPDSALDAPTKRRRAFALLALVAGAAPQPIGREKLLGFLWPESDSERARNSLRQTIFSLRRELGDDIFLPESASGVQLNPALLTVDLWDFRAAIERKAYGEAVVAYRGPFLDGFHIPGLSEFSQWVEAERESLARQYMEALDTLARGATEAGRHDEAVSWYRRQAAAEPLSCRVALALIKALADAGDRSGALQQASAYERLVREQLDADPDPSVTEFVASLRRVSASESRVVAVADERPRRVAAESASVAVAVVPQLTPRVGVVEPHELSRAVAPVDQSGFDRRLAFVAAAVLLTLGAVVGRLSYIEHTDAAVTRPDPTPVRVLSSGAKNVGGRDPGSRVVKCEGPACPPGPLPQDAYIIPKHYAHAAAIAGTGYIAPVPDGNTVASPGYKCCTTATFEHTFTLPSNAVSATITVSVHADNQAAAAINGVEFGRQKDKWAADNYSDVPESFRMTFSPDPSGTNRLHVTLWDGGGALALHYNAIVTYETIVDSDGDGIPDDSDAFPASDRRPTVVVGACDAGVVNQPLPQPAGATFNDLIAMALTASRTAGRVDTVKALAESWKGAGLVSKLDHGRIAACADKAK